MLFNSIEFIFIFLPITLLIYFILQKYQQHRLTVFILVLASLFFYSWWNPRYILLLIISIIFNYSISNYLTTQEYYSKKRKFYLILGITTNLLVLTYFKYSNFLINNFNSIFNTPFNLPDVILPLAISFFTFQQIAYLVDSYKNTIPNHNFLDYCLFVSFFPQLIAGPIVHHEEILSQFSNLTITRSKLENLTVGLTIFMVGLFKKVVVADTVAQYANPVFNAALIGNSFNFIDAWTAALAYSFQLYFDFSGYSEMAIGAGRMFGIKLPINFNSPYKAVNISDFWRRWHITLSNFLRDYLYIPLGGNRKGEIRRYCNLMITMLIGGLWHGAGWNFIIWGGLHGFYLGLNHQWHKLLKNWGIDLTKVSIWARIIGCLITFIAVVVSWVMFRSETLESGFLILKKMSGLEGIVLYNSITDSKKKLLLGLCFWVWFLPNTLELILKYQPALNINSIENKLFSESKLLYSIKQKVLWKPTRIHGLIMGIVTFITLKILLDASQSEFLYFNF